MLNRESLESNWTFSVMRTAMTMRMKKKMLMLKTSVKNSRMRAGMRSLEGWAWRGKQVDWRIILRNDERSRQRNTSHVPNRAILMHTSLPLPKQARKWSCIRWSKVTIRLPILRQCQHCSLCWKRFRTVFSKETKPDDHGRSSFVSAIYLWFLFNRIEVNTIRDVGVQQRAECNPIRPGVREVRDQNTLWK